MNATNVRDTTERVDLFAVGGIRRGELASIPLCRPDQLDNRIRDAIALLTGATGDGHCAHDTGGRGEEPASRQGDGGGEWHPDTCQGATTRAEAVQ